MPASGQHICGSKADIFTPVNPMGGTGTEEDASIQEAMSAEVDKRMNNALNDLREKYADKDADNCESSVHGPSGAAYQQASVCLAPAGAPRAAAARGSGDGRRERGG